MEDVEISVVLPCLNEEKTLKKCIEKIKQSFQYLDVSGEIIVSDNGSTDNSLKIAQDCQVKIVHCSTKGYGITLRKGFSNAKGKYIIMGDADDTYDFLEIPKFYNSIKETNSDIIVGSRLKGNIEKGAMPLISRYFGTPFLTSLINILYKTNFSDTNCGLRIFRRDAFEKMNFISTGMEFASEMIIVFQLNKCKLTEITTSLSKSVEGRIPHLNIIRDGFRHLILILTRKFYKY